MAAYNYLAPTTVTGADGVDMAGGDSLLITASGTLNAISAGFDGANSSGGDNIVNVFGTLAGTDAAFKSGGGGDLIDVHLGGSVLGGAFATIEVGGGSNTLINDGTVYSPNTVTVYFGSGDNTIANTGSMTSTTNTVILAEGTTNTLTNSGTISTFGTSGDTDAAYFAGGKNTITNKTTGTIQDASHLAYGSYAVQTVGDSNTLINAGHITSGFDAVYFEVGADNTVNNSGNIHGADYGVYAGYGSNTFHNSGTISTGNFSGAETLYAGEGSNILNNTGTGVISGPDAYAVDFSGGNNTIHNAGHITSGNSYDAVYLDGGSNTIVNGGTIATSGSGGDGLHIYGGGSNILTNKSTGLISSSGSDARAVDMHGGTNTVYNHGTITDHGASGSWAVKLHEGGNTVTNTGHIVGNVQLGEDSTSSDFFYGASGTFNGTVYGGSGADTIEVGAGHSSLVGGGGADFLQGGSGINTFIYNAVSDSNVVGIASTGYDTVDAFNGNSDSFQFTNIFTGSGSITLGATVSGVLSGGAAFNVDLANAMGSLSAGGAELFHATSGDFKGDTFLIVDSNGTAGYQSGADYCIQLTDATHLGSLGADLHCSI